MTSQIKLGVYVLFGEIICGSVVKHMPSILRVHRLIASTWGSGSRNKFQNTEGCGLCTRHTHVHTHAHIHTHMHTHTHVQSPGKCPDDLQRPH